MTLFTTDSVTTQFAVVIVRTGQVKLTTNSRDLAISYLKDNARFFDGLEVREVVTRVESRRSYRPAKPALRSAPACPVDRDIAIPGVME